MSRPRYLAVLLSALFVLAAVAKRHEVVRIGFLGELSGRGSVFGQAGRNGATLAIEQVNATGGVLGHSVELVAVSYRDGKGDVLQGLRRLEEAGVEAIVGPMTSSASMELLQPEPLTDLVMVSPTSESSRLAGVDDQFFRVAPASSVSVRFLVGHMLAERGVKRVCIVRDTDNDAFTRDWLEEFSREYTDMGGEILEVIPFRSSEFNSFSGMCARVAALGADGVLLLTHATDTAMFCQQVAKRRLPLSCFCTSWASSPQLVRLGGKSVEGLTWVQGSSYDDDTPLYRTFCRQYQARFNSLPDYAALHAYEATWMLVTALNGDGSIPLQQRLRDLGTFIGPQGTLVISPTGDVVRDLHLLTIRQGDIVSIARSREPFSALRTH